MFVALLFFGGMIAVMGLTEIILTGILHINLYLERKRDEKKTTGSSPRYKKYEKMFKV